MIPQASLDIYAVATWYWTDTEGLLYAPCALYYATTLFLFYQPLINHSKLRMMHPTLLQVVYLHRSMHLFTNQIPSSARIISSILNQYILNQ